MDILMRLVAGGTCAGAGFAVFLAILYGRFVHMRDQKSKRLLVLFTLMSLIFIPFLAGFIAGGGAWVFLPGGAVICLVVWSMVRRSMFRRMYGTAGPVETINRSMSIHKPFTTFDVCVERYEISMHRMGASRLRIAHISDLHVSDFFPETYYRRIMQIIRLGDPDLLFVTGDLVTSRNSAGLLESLFAEPVARQGAYAVLGNHDHWAGADIVAGALEPTTLRLLSDVCENLTLAAGLRVKICGVEAPWSGNSLPDDTGPDADMCLMLTHTPDNIYSLLGHRPDAVFAGHCHAGQVRIPGIGAIVAPSAYGCRFVHGHFTVEGCHLFVTSGVGVGTPRCRIYCKPDIFFVDLSGHGGDPPVSERRMPDLERILLK